MQTNHQCKPTSIQIIIRNKQRAIAGSEKEIHGVLGIVLLSLEANQGVDVVVGINVIELKRSRLLDVFTLSQIRIAGTVASVEIRLHVVRRDLRVFEQFLIPLLNS